MKLIITDTKTIKQYDRESSEDEEVICPEDAIVVKHPTLFGKQRIQVHLSSSL